MLATTMAAVGLVGLAPLGPSALAETGHALQKAITDITKVFSSNNGNPAVVVNNTSTGYALAANAVSSNAVNAFSTSGTGVYGQGGFTGIGSQCTNANGNEYVGYDNNGKNQMFVNCSGSFWLGGSAAANSASQNAVTGTSGTGSGVYGQGGFTGIGAGCSSASGNEYVGYDNNGKNQMFINCSGSMYLGGNVTALGYYTHTLRSRDGRFNTSFGAQTTQATLEDVGEARLIDGISIVRLDPQFASAIDFAQGYSVFVTPEGESNVLFVASKTAQGFSVRESGHGHSTIAYSYRIVAHPADASPARLPAATVRTLPAIRNHRLSALPPIH